VKETLHTTVSARVTYSRVITATKVLMSTLTTVSTSTVGMAQFLRSTVCVTSAC